MVNQESFEHAKNHHTRVRCTPPSKISYGRLGICDCRVLDMMYRRKGVAYLRTINRVDILSSSTLVGGKELVGLLTKRLDTKH